VASKQYTLDQLVVARQLRLVYERLPVSVLLTVVVSLIFIGLIVPFFDHRKLLEWVLLTHFVCGARYLLWRSYARAHPTPAQSRFWSVLFVIGTVAAGASWAFGPLTMMPAAGRVEMALLVVTLLSVSSVAVATLGAHFKAMLGFIGSALPLTIFAVVRNGGPVEIVLGAALGAAFIALVAVGRQSNVTTTQLLKTELELSDAVAETAAARVTAEASSRAKSQFLANMSHEVRTPLNGILGMSEILSAGELDSRQRRQVELLRESALHLLHIVNDILDLSKIEAGRIELAEDECDLTALIEQAAALMAPSANQAGLKFAVELAPDLPRQVIVDGMRLRQVLLNLLSNAIKFTPRGSVVLRARRDAAIEPHGQLTLSFEVADTGIGIGAADAARIFDAFTQADESTTRRFGGTGLGLAVCRQLTQLMGGGITMESQPGAGSTFRFSVKVRASRLVSQSIEHTQISEAHG
jgi:signal transduction histidine kinase